MQDPLITNILNLLARKDIISLAAGAPSQDLYPTGILQIYLPICPVRTAAAWNTVQQLEKPNFVNTWSGLWGEGTSTHPENIMVTSDPSRVGSHHPDHGRTG
jgi:hypothetical protein